ncbi:MAG TPA: butyrate kinase [Bacteroidales bacterium]|jgi:butyrate kinase|nr:butyrate kinase [Bacteroidales bacterium]HNR42391.1 butyrate kinase [Bacteroidales bacterium]HPM18438.1 butyrate kinase [Bacteroidales bacterium]HQG77458.1 butyrate kinase [Bacteroidales bacterium]
MEKILILAVNPGSTSTKFAVFEENRLLFEKTLRHTPMELEPYRKVTDQLRFRKDMIVKELTARNVDFTRIRAIVGRGGLVKPIESGIYEVNDRMRRDLETGIMGEHASNLGGLIAADIASSLPGAKAYIVDPVVVDELQPVARISGHPAIERISIFHALNQKAVGRLYASSAGRRYEDMNLIIAHMGGGISVGAHRKGRVIDVNNALNGDGSFSPERSGGLPSGQLVDLCFSGKYSHQEIKSMLTGKGGMMAYLGTNNFIEMCDRADQGDKEAILIRDALAYQVSRDIGAMAAVLEGQVDAIILTGGLAYHEEHVQRIKKMVGFIAGIYVFPGEDEIKALAFNGLLALEGKIEIKTYV